jgi:uncharacterized membrane protein
MADRKLVLAFFANENAADMAVESLKGWDKANEEIKLGAIGVLVKNEKGKVKVHKLGQRATAKGAGVGTVLGVIAAILSGGLGLLAGVAGGAISGGILGAFVHKGLGISKDELDRIGAELDGGRAAVGVLADPDEEQPIMQQLLLLGGKPETYSVTESALEDAAQAAAAASETDPIEA